MRKTLLLLILLVTVLFVATPAMADNTWDWDVDSDTEGMDGAEFMVTGDDVQGTMESVAGYAIDGIAADTYAPNADSQVYLDTDRPLTVPTYSLPCPAAQLNMTCKYEAAHPQTDVETPGTDDGIILDDLFTYVEDFHDETANTQRHIAQVLDILFYVNGSTDNDPAGKFTGNKFKAAVAIGQTLDQDLADRVGTNGNGILAGIYQQFELGDEGGDPDSLAGRRASRDGEKNETGGYINSDLHDGNTEVAFLDQVIWQYLSDIEPRDPDVSGIGSQGIVQKYFSMFITGDGGDLCDVINEGKDCKFTDDSTHLVDKSFKIKDDINLVDDIDGTISKSTSINNNPGAP